MKRVLIAILTITMTSGVALFCPGTSGVGGAFAAETSEVADTPEEETSEDTSEKEEPSDKPKDSEKTAEKEETSKESEKTTEKKETSEASKKARDETNTGDDSNASAWIVLMVLAVGALGGAVVYRKKN